MRLFYRIFAVVLVLLGTSISSLRAETWPGFRGAEGTGVSNEKNLPVEWSSSEDLQWDTKLPGIGNSSPAVTSDRIYVTSKIAEDQSLWVYSIDRADGHIVWKKEIGSGEIIGNGPPGNFRGRHNAATPTASADETHVWAYFGTGHLACLTKEGEIVWEQNLAEDYGDYDIKFGMGSSPRLWGDLLYIACMHKGPSYVLALDKLTGKEVWMTMRNYRIDDDQPDSYSTPMVLKMKDHTEIVVSGANHLNAYDSLTGKQIWISSGLAVDAAYGRISSSPAISDEIIFAGAAGKRQGIAVRTGGKGDITESPGSWRVEKVTDCPTPVIYQGLVFALRDDGVCVCYDAKSGRRRWQKRITGRDKELFRASPVAADGHVYLLSLDGQCTVVKADAKFTVVAKNLVPIPEGDDGRFFATPAFSDGVIYLRSRDRLYAIGKMRKVAAQSTDEQTNSNSSIKLTTSRRPVKVREVSEAKSYPVITNSIDMKLVEIPPGEFMMGAPETEGLSRDAERPIHKVRITKPLLVGQFEVTQAEYERVTGTNPSWFQKGGGGDKKVAGLDTSRFPVESLNWDAAVEFCLKLSDLPAEKAAGRVYRLPSEAEWQYACRAGTTTAFHYGDALGSKQANILGIYPFGGAPKAPSLKRSTEVGQYEPNAFGLYDMHGNVGEWLNDWYGAHYYETSPVDDPPGPVSGKDRMTAGGSWNTDAFRCRSGYRNAMAQAGVAKYFGFRVVCDVK